MTLHDIEIVILVEGDIHRLVEHAVPLGVVPLGDFAARAHRHGRLAIGLELPHHVQEAVCDPDVAVTVHPHAMGVDGDVGIEGADEFSAGIILHHHHGGVAVIDQQIALGGQRHGGDVAELLARHRLGLVDETIGQLLQAGGRLGAHGNRRNDVGVGAKLRQRGGGREQRGQDRDRYEILHSGVFPDCFPAHVWPAGLPDILYQRE